MVKPKKSKVKKPAAPKVSDAAQLFMSLVEQFDYRQRPNAAAQRLTNVTFFAGAGFSKSWDPNAPVGAQLFSLKTEVMEEVANIGVLSRMFGLDSLSRITPDQLRQIIYQMDMYERYPDVRSRYVDEQNIAMFRGALRAAIVDRYNELTQLNYFDPTASKFPLDNPTVEQLEIVGFFRNLLAKTDGSTGFAEGVRTHFVTTNYDYVIETILDNVLSPDDSHFLYSYRGFTPIQIVDGHNHTPVHEHWLTQHLLKINGGFEILRRGSDYILDYSQRSPSSIIGDPPIVMLASREQDYSDPYFRTIFPKVVRLMRESMVLVIVGYSLPEDDALLRFFIRQFAEEPEDGFGKYIFYIDINENSQKRKTLEAVFPSMATLDQPTVITYQGSFSAFAKECMSLSPAAPDPF